MIITPILIAGYAVCGVASAFGGWLFHKVVKTHKQVTALEARVDALEK